MTFTDLFIKNLKPQARPYREWEKSNDKGFGVQVSSKGTKTFFQFYRHNGQRCFLKLGRYPDIRITEARDAAREARKLIDQGINPRIVKQQEIIQQEEEVKKLQQQQLLEQMKGSVHQLIKYYIEHLKAQNKRSWREVERALKYDVLGSLDCNIKARDTRPEHIRKILNTVIMRNSKIQANRVRSYLSAAFAYGIKHDFDPNNLNHEVMFGIETNPVRDVPKAQSKEAPRERNLNFDEIKTFWQGFTDHYSPFTEIALKLILTTGGQRVLEIIGAKKSEINYESKLWELNSSRVKNGRAHLIPLNDLSIRLLKQLEKERTKLEKKFKFKSTYLFPKFFSTKEDAKESSPHMPISTLSRAISRFCSSTDENGKKKKPFPKFTPRDLRRTFKTRGGEIGISKEIRDRIQNHALQDVSSKHYDLYDYLPEKRAALDLWDKKLKGVIN